MVMTGNFITQQDRYLVGPPWKKHGILLVGISVGVFVSRTG